MRANRGGKNIIERGMIGTGIEKKGRKEEESQGDKKIL
jgi:hypothetical protein